MGPFVFESIVGGKEIVVKKNPDYWKKGLPHLEQIVFRTIPDSHVRLQSLEKGELDFMSHPDEKDVARARRNPNLVYLSTPGWNWDYQSFTFPPFQKPEFPNQNKLVRQAISYAIDREAIRREIYFGEATVTDSPVPEGFLGYRPVPLRYPKAGDLKKARELMAQAGVKGYEVEVITSDKDWLRRELELVAGMVSQIGITYKIRHLDMGSYNNLWLNSKYQQLLEDITIVSPDPDSTVWWFLHSKGSATSGYNVPEMDTMLDDARAELDPKKREALYHRIVDRDLEDCPKVYHVNVNYVRLHKKGLAGFSPSPQEYIELFTNVRWEA
jgi:peptide/nickel transport system substrate-binding protein